MFIIFDDSYQKKSTMCGQIELKKLEEFVSLLYKSKKITKRKKKGNKKMTEKDCKYAENE